MAGDPGAARLDVLVTEPNMWPHLARRSDLAGQGIDLEFVSAQDTSAVERALGRCTAYVGVPFDGDMARASGPGLRLVQIAAAGTDHLDLAELAPTVTACNAYGHERSVAEHVLMVLLAARRSLLAADSALRRGTWLTRMHTERAAQFSTLDQLTVGVVGLGRIGTAVARLLGDLGITTRAVTRTPRPHHADIRGLEAVEAMDAVGALFDRCDAVVLCAPLTPQTGGLVDRALIDRLGPDGTLVNVARGGLVREEDLYAALRDRTLGSAALDVWSAGIAPGRSAPSPHPFEQLDNVVMTPHYSATATTTYRLRAQEVADNLFALAAGDPLRNIIRPATA